MRQWGALNGRELAAYRVAIAFLEHRLEERETVEWALRLYSNDAVKRMAVYQLLDQRQSQGMREPWNTAWRLIEDSWNDPTLDDLDRFDIYSIKRRLNSGERSGTLAAEIANFVRPRLELKPLSNFRLSYRKPPKRPKTIEDLFSATLGGAELVDLTVLKLADINEADFLWSLAFYLEAGIHSALDTAKRIGWDGEYRYWKIGRLNRAYYVQPTRHDQGEDEPDAYNHGIAPSVKLLHAVVVRLSELDLSSAVNFVRRLKDINSPYHIRLWAALSFNPHITPVVEVEQFLVSLNDLSFWDLHYYPEIAELRSRRFNELNQQTKKKVISRFLKGPPLNHWPKDAEAERVKDAQLYWAVRELKRIEIAGGQLSPDIQSWVEHTIQKFQELLEMTRIDEGFPESAKATWVKPQPDSKYDLLEGEERLKLLEKALSAERDWSSNPSGRASDWIREQGNTEKIISDMASTCNGGGNYPKVWEKFGWSHSPNKQDSGLSGRDVVAEGKRVLALIMQLPDDTIQRAINGISHWLSVWEKQVAKTSDCYTVWFKVWQMAVVATNNVPPAEEDLHLNAVAHLKDDQQHRDLDTLNTPAGKLVGVFLAACPNLHKAANRPFRSSSPLRKMREAIFHSTGNSLLIARHRLVECLPYFMSADPGWTRKHLISPLTEDNTDSLPLWRAIARRTHFKEVLAIIGNTMVMRAFDIRLDRDTRHSLVFSIMVECLHAYLNGRDPVVPRANIQQMIRSLEDEVRAYGAEAVQRFIHDMSNVRTGEAVHSPEELFKSAAKPFLQEVWPQERSLVSPGVSKAFAEIPSVSGEAFADAVKTIERFLVPFDCWSMGDYGLYGEEGDQSKLSRINNEKKAKAFLQLLDATVGTSEGAVVPHDLGMALDQIGKVAPNLIEDRVFRRLATAARRG
ncbi:hypothetical protein [Pelotalea chapellei]|uniref:Uncharacterized protein n=1 Tax=Pelotalea chapellei TaxID=44671 RepID=A0ABS5U4V0_9BACT|nr:hypothetical protein [Pelotalea chapellei]MBT1070699.1 hypothetical protein [Pelotalea chapellei]